MKLTVRTLLAWLDEVLPEQEREALGQKVRSSPVAAVLIQRIRTVVSRTSLSAPVPLAKGLADDANSVAEYIDNTLPADQLEQFERICVDSDVHLAEVAACHGLLAEAVRHPELVAPLDEAGQQQLLGAMNHRSAVLAASAEKREARELAKMMRDECGDGHDTVLLSDDQAADRRHGTKRTASRGAWGLATFAVLSLAALGALLVWSITGVTTGRARRVAAVQPPAAFVVDAPNGPRPESAPPRPETPQNAAAGMPSPPQPAAPTQPPADGTVENQAVQQDRDEPDSPLPVQGPPPPVAAVAPPVAPQPASIAGESGAVPAVPPPAAAPPDPVATQVVPQGDALAIAAPTSAAAPAAASVAAAASAAAVPTAPEIPVAAAAVPGPAAGAAAAEAEDRPDQAGFGTVGPDGLLLHRSTTDAARAWERFPAGARLARTEELLVPPGCQPVIDVRGVLVRLLPATRATLTMDADGTPRVEVVFGRVVARASRPDARLGLTVGRLAGTVTAGLAGGVAVSVELERPPGVDPAGDASRVRGRIFSVTGGIGWEQSGGEETAAAGPAVVGIGEQGMLEARSSIDWESIDPAVVSVTRHADLPEWIQSGQRIDWLEKGAGEALAAKVAATQPLTRALREMSAADRREENRMAAAATLALMGEFDELVELLCEDAADRRLKNVRWAALEAETVPLALARGANAAAKLRKSFEDHGPHGKAEVLLRMARGFSDADLAAGGAATLVEALDDPDLVVRRYAYKCLCDVTRPAAADRLRYRPDSLPDPRREGVNWWQGQLAKGLVRRGGAAAQGAAQP